MRLWRSFALLVWCPLFLVNAAGDQPAESSKEPATNQPVSIKDQVTGEREELAREIESAKRALESATKDGKEAPPALTRRIELLTRLDLQCQQILAAQEHDEELKVSLAQLRSDLDDLRLIGPAESRPFSFLFIETLRDRWATELGRADSLAEEAKEAQSALKAARALVEGAERSRRQARESAEKEKDPSKRAGLSAALQLRQLETRSARGEVLFREIEAANQKLEVEAHEIRLTFLAEKIELVSGDVQFHKQGLNDILGQIDDQEYQINQTLDWAKVELDTLVSQWMESRRRLEVSIEKAPVLVEEVEARRLTRQVRQREVELLGQQLQALADARKAWERRYRTINKAVEKDELAAWESETRSVLERLEREIRLNTGRLGVLRGEALTLDGQIAATEEGQGDLRRWLNDQKVQLARLIRVYERTLGRLETERRLHEKLVNEVGTQIKTVTWGERLAGAWQVIRDVWNYEMTSVEDNPITVQKMVVGTILLFLGIYFSRILSILIGGRFLPRFGLNESLAAAVQSLLFYFLVVTVVMFSLKIVNVPLTAFTILGGALAIGIGFGSQSIVNDFISGLIILTERSIRVGDLVEIEDLIGKIEHIGPRSTRVRAPENMDIIVPNSFFLQKNVVNWTLSDDRYRAHVSVGIAYGSPTRDATKLIRKALDEHGKVLPKPPPIILFADFGDNALIFEAHFWLRMRRTMDRRMIESDIRFRIDTLFREANIAIAFPQRDVHLHSQRPVEVRVLQEQVDGSQESDFAKPDAAGE